MASQSSTSAAKESDSDILVSWTESQMLQSQSQETKKEATYCKNYIVNVISLLSLFQWVTDLQNGTENKGCHSRSDQKPPLEAPNNPAEI